MNRLGRAFIAAALMMTGLSYGAEDKGDRAATSGRWTVENPADGPPARKLAREIAEEKEERRLAEQHAEDEVKTSQSSAESKDDSCR